MPIGLTRRVRNHVNPFHVQYQTAAEPPHWERIYAQLAQPFHLDIGTGCGRFLLAMAEQQPDWNFLGVEIRQPLVERANQWRQELHLTNLHFLAANINVSLRSLFAPQDLSLVTIQFPDPWFKKRHQKRRVVQPTLVADLALLLRSGGSVFLQSDIAPVAEEMAERFSQHPAFINPNSHPLDHNPLGIPTQRESQCVRLGLPIYRYWFDRL
ncbi:MAG: tRNA (guanosine(46)-N7)-methyltransferase TrmB [Cyanobacteriota bacterium]|nr:tRNA (guanosine(46)-N7)-methyltransferase TrmB [Cyanobacteriota bacterium]